MNPQIGQLWYHEQDAWPVWLYVLLEFVGHEHGDDIFRAYNLTTKSMTRVYFNDVTNQWWKLLA